jgi:hypothetical protein
MEKSGYRIFLLYICNMTPHFWYDIMSFIRLNVPATTLLKICTVLAYSVLFLSSLDSMFLFVHLNRL